MGFQVGGGEVVNFIDISQQALQSNLFLVPFVVCPFYLKKTVACRNQIFSHYILHSISSHIFANEPVID